MPFHTEKHLCLSEKENAELEQHNCMTCFRPRSKRRLSRCEMLFIDKMSPASSFITHG